MTVDELVRLIEARTLPREAWTHAAHVAVAAAYLLDHGPAAMPRFRRTIRAYNVACGVQNTDTSGYHETITRFFMSRVESHLRQMDTACRDTLVAQLLATECGDARLPLRYYSAQRLWSVEARRAWVEPDLEPLA